LALDLGAARVGVAACDKQRILAYPVATLPADQTLIEKVAALIEEYEAAALIVGYPLALDGSQGIAATKIREQARTFRSRITQPIWLVDERMSTAEAHQRLRATGRNAKTARGVVDAQAAVGILESVLHALDQGRVIGQELETEEAHG